MQVQEERIRSVCKHAVKRCMFAARFANFSEEAQVALFADGEYAKEEYDKPDFETFKQTYVTAYMKTQELLVPKSSPFSVRPLPSQIAENMRMDEQLYGFERAYAWVKEKVEEAVGLPQEQETTP
jgi:hypothetical protein